LDLRFADVVRQGGRIVAIRWRPTKHADAPQVVPVSREAQRTLETLVATRPGVGTAPLFPSFHFPEQPLRAKVADAWLPEAETRAGVPKQDGGLWHPSRRAWATKRKHFPDKDVAEAGGWKTIAVMKDSYQQVDDRTCRRSSTSPCASRTARPDTGIVAAMRRSAT
jgi:integrase